MKKIIFILLINVLFGVASPLLAQDNRGIISVSGKYKNVSIKLAGVSNGPNDQIREAICNGEDLAKMVSRLKKLEKEINEKDKEIKELEKQIQDLSQGGRQGGGQTNNPNHKVVDSLCRQNKDLLEEKWNLEDQRNALRDSVQNLEKSVRLLNDSLEKVNKKLADLLNVKPTKNTSSHVGAYYRIGSPLLFNSLLNQKEGSERFWHRQMTLSHQVGVYWNSASFSNKLPMTYGVGLEYSWMKFSAGIGQLSDSPYKFMDNDGDSCTAYLTYNNLRETATLRYISIPLTFSIGAPRADRISGYFQVSLIPSFLLKDSLSVGGKYSCMGHYDTISNQWVNLNLTNFPDLGFVENQDIGGKRTKNSKVMNRVVFSGRLSGGVYIPLCNTTKGQISKWVVKLGANLDFSIPYKLRKEVESENININNLDQYLSQYKIFSSSSSWSVNPSLEVGILYMFNKK